MQITPTLLYRPDGNVKCHPEPLVAERLSTKQKILEAAAEIARETGPGSLSLDAVAAKAGVSKGGLLYHFPSKARLLEAVVEMFIQSFDQALDERERARHGRANSLTEAFLDLAVADHDCNRPPPSGLLAALAEDPDFLAPARRHQRLLLDRMKENASDPVMATIVFLTVQGMRNMHLLNLAVISNEEFEDVAGKLAQILRASAKADAA